MDGQLATRDAPHIFPSCFPSLSCFALHPSRWLLLLLASYLVSIPCRPSLVPRLSVWWVGVLVSRGFLSRVCACGLSWACILARNQGDLPGLARFRSFPAPAPVQPVPVDTPVHYRVNLPAEDDLCKHHLRSTIHIFGVVVHFPLHRESPSSFQSWDSCSEHRRAPFIPDWRVPRWLRMGHCWLLCWPCE